VFREVTFINPFKMNKNTKTGNGTVDGACNCVNVGMTNNEGKNGNAK
jgi:hypothetical protein